jgi:hypothetical protein
MPFPEPEWYSPTIAGAEDEALFLGSEALPGMPAILVQNKAAVKSLKWSIPVGSRSPFGFPFY